MNALTRLRLLAVVLGGIALVIAIGPAFEGVYDGRSLIAVVFLIAGIVVGMFADMLESRDG